MLTLPSWARGGGCALPATALWLLTLPCHAAESSESGKPATLEPVTVTGSKKEQQPAGKLSASSEEMRHVPGSLGDPLKSLQSLPGVASVNDASSQPAIRGSRPEDNRFVIDGLPASNLFHVGGLTSVLHPDLVSRFDLYSAAFGPEHGNAIGGVVDVRLRRPRTDRIGGTLDLSLLGADLLIEGPVADNQSFYFAGKRSWLDLVAKRASDGDEPDSDGTIVQMPRYTDYLGKYFWRLNEANELQFHTSGATDRLDLEVPPGSTLAQQQPVLAGSGSFRTDNHMQALSLNSQLGSNASNRLSIGQNTERNRNRIGAALNVEARSNDRFLIDEFKFGAGAAHEVTLGGELHQVRSTYRINARNATCTEFSPECDYGSATDVATAGQVDARATYLYASDRWQFAPDWAATVGVHHSRDSYLRRVNTQPRLGLEWRWSPSTLLSAGWGRYDEAPQAEQIVADIGNPGLDHLHATHAVVGVSQKLAAGWSVRVEAYRKTMRDLVVADADRNYINGGSGTAHGLELLLNKDAHENDRLTGWLSVSWARSHRRNDITGEEFRFAYDQPLILNAVARYQLPYGWVTSARWSYHTGLPDTAVVGTGSYPDGRVRPLYGPLNGDRLPAYHRLDLRGEKQITRDLHVYVELINAYARKNVSGYGYSADYKTRYEIHQLGLLPSVGMKLAF
jgi:outer membrane receptor for ferrienterochelin and colicin